MLCWESMNEKFYTPKQVAEILQVHQYTVLKWIREGKLRALKFGRVYRTTESEINAFLGQTAHESAQDVIRTSPAGQAGTLTLSQATLPIPDRFPAYASSKQNIVMPEAKEGEVSKKSYSSHQSAYQAQNIPINDQIYSLNIES